ncbi:MAG TPA: hypothetical protein VFX30_10715, partial [bacterium]|nr:hypothetical protein [bacterium]
RRTGAIADRIDAYEVQAEGLANLVNSYESRLAAAFAPFAEREASLTLSPPAAAVPAPPSFASRRFQAGPDTPRSVLELLASVDPRQHATVNLMPEIALFARDEDVYASLLKLLHLRRRYGTRGTYVNYLENGRFRDGYAPNFTPRSAQGNSREIVRFVDDAGEEHSLPSSEFRMAVALERVNPAQMEKEVRSTDATYHFYKIKYYTALLGIDPEMTDRYVALFEQHHLLAGSPLFPTLRLQFLAAHFLDDDVRGMLMKRLSASVPAVSIRRRLEGAGEAASLMKIPLELLARQDGKELSADEMNAFLYLYGFQSLLADQPPEERHRMKAEILGNAIEELAPDLRYTGGVRQPLDSWTVREGIIGADAAREKFRHAVVLSTPDSSHLLLDRGNARVAERFLKTRVPERALKDVFGSTVDLPAGGAGYRLVSPEEYGNWYAELIRRLELLSEKPTPASDSVFYVLTASDPREAAELRPELLGILLEDAENRSVTRETLLDRVALWMMHNSDRFHPMRTFRDLSKQWKKHLGPASRRP